MKKYVWLNINTGEFSDSWDAEFHNRSGMDKDLETWEKAKNTGWKLIEYQCLNVPEFDFYSKMKIVTNTGTK